MPDFSEVLREPYIAGGIVTVLLVAPFVVITFTNWNSSFLNLKEGDWIVISDGAVRKVELRAPVADLICKIEVSAQGRDYTCWLEGNLSPIVVNRKTCKIIT